MASIAENVSSVELCRAQPGSRTTFTENPNGKTCLRQSGWSGSNPLGQLLTRTFRAAAVGREFFPPGFDRTEVMG